MNIKTIRQLQKAGVRERRKQNKEEQIIKNKKRKEFLKQRRDYIDSCFGSIEYQIEEAARKGLKNVDCEFTEEEFAESYFTSTNKRKIIKKLKNKGFKVAVEKITDTVFTGVDEWEDRPKTIFKVSW